VIWDSDNILLTTKDSSNHYDFRYKLFRDARGAILEIAYSDFWTIKPIANTFPRNTLRVSSFYQIANLSATHNYKCYAIKDGSLFNAYYKDDEWRLFTRNNLDIQEDAPPFPFKETTIVGIREYLEDKDTSKVYHLIVSDPEVHKLCTEFNISDVEDGRVTFEDAMEMIKNKDDMSTLGIAFRSSNDSMHSNILCEFPSYRLTRQMFYINNLTIDEGTLVDIYRSSKYKKELRKLFPSFKDIFVKETDEDRLKIEDIYNYYTKRTPTSYPELVYEINLDLNIKNIVGNDKIKERITKYIIDGR